MLEIETQIIINEKTLISVEKDSLIDILKEMIEVKKEAKQENE